MRNVNIDAEQIGNVVNAEQARFGNLESNINSEKIILDMLDKIYQQAYGMLQNNSGLPPDQSALAECVVGDIPEIRSERDSDIRKSKFDAFVEKINGIMGESANLIGNITSLAKLF